MASLQTGLRTRLSEPVLTRAFYVLLTIVLSVFVISTIPGVRATPGYNLFLDGWLNNICYMLSPILCWLRARRATAYQQQLAGPGHRPRCLRPGERLLDDLRAYRRTRNRSRRGLTRCGCRSMASRSRPCCWSSGTSRTAFP